MESGHQTRITRVEYRELNMGTSSFLDRNQRGGSISHQTVGVRKSVEAVRPLSTNALLWGSIKYNGTASRFGDSKGRYTDLGYTATYLGHAHRLPLFLGPLTTGGLFLFLIYSEMSRGY